jgi:hypothetical protein
VPPGFIKIPKRVQEELKRQYISKKFMGCNFLKIIE